MQILYPQGLVDTRVQRGNQLSQVQMAAATLDRQDGRHSSHVQDHRVHSTRAPDRHREVAQVAAPPGGAGRGAPQGYPEHSESGP